MTTARAVATGQQRCCPCQGPVFVSTSRQSTGKINTGEVFRSGHEKTPENTRRRERSWCAQRAVTLESCTSSTGLPKIDRGCGACRLRRIAGFDLAPDQPARVLGGLLDSHRRQGLRDERLPVGFVIHQRLARPLDLAWVAEGRTDAAVILSNKPWDTAAGILPAREAGALTLDAMGQPHTFKSRETIATAAGIADVLLTLIQRSG